MTIKTYPVGAVASLLDSVHVSPATRAALRARGEARDLTARPRFFTAGEMATLRAACARLLPTDDLLDPATAIDERLAAGTGDGWRYDEMPPDGQAYRTGLAGLDESARLRHGDNFVGVGGEFQDRLLADVQAGQAPGETWNALNARRFFEDLLAEVSQAVMAHPVTQDAIGYAGMADQPRWERIGLDELDEREPRAIDANDARG